MLDTADKGYCGYRLLNSSSYIELTEFIKGKKVVFNIKNADNQCLKQCIARLLNMVEKDPQRITKLLRVQSEKLDWSGINFPVKLDKISKFEKQNENIAVDALGYEQASSSPSPSGFDFYPFRISKEENRKHLINLLLIGTRQPDVLGPQKVPSIKCFADPRLKS